MSGSPTEQATVPDSSVVEEKAGVVDGEQAAGQAGAREQPNGHSQGVDGIEQGMAGIKLENDLHKACAEGSLDDVRAVLSRSLEGLESLDAATGCTPIVLAIRGNHSDVVRELLAAGAIVPPPGLTSDPLMLSILYPQPIYQSYAGPEYYPQPFYPPPNGRFMPGYSRKESPPQGVLSPQQGAANLPPADVAKSIPCRNFPNCKYGAACVFYHPVQSAFYGPGPNGFQGQGFEYGQFQSQSPMGAAPFYPQQQPTSQYQQNEQSLSQNLDSNTAQASDSVLATIPDVPDASSQHDQPPQPHPQSQQPSGLSVFVPTFQPGQNGPYLGSAPLSPPSQFGMSPMSPSSMMSASLPSLPPPEQFFATSPPNGVPFGHGHLRRQSFNQGGFPSNRPFGHGKKPSFSGGPRPFAGRSMAPGSLGTWKDGIPPPCAFFQQGKCRNGEYCKFPHLDNEGNDCRHPDIIRGVLAPMPPLSRQPRPMRMGMPQNFGPYDPNFRQQQHQAFMAGRPLQPNGDADQVQEDAAAIAEAETPIQPTSSNEESTISEEALDLSSSRAKSADAVPTITRSASQPGTQRFANGNGNGQVNGHASRSHSPAPSNVSFHGNGHPRRVARGPFAPNFANGHAQPSHSQMNGRSTSASSETKRQRVPGADEFPALGGQNASAKEGLAQASIKTAAQVLSDPAPYRPQVAKRSSVDQDNKDDGEKVEKAESVTMDSDSDSDVVIISKPAASPSAASGALPNGTNANSPGKRSSISFASIAGTVGSPALDAAPVGVTA